MVLIILCVVLLILLLLAIGITLLICFFAGEAFSWGIVALVWLFLLMHRCRWRREWLGIKQATVWAYRNTPAT